MAKSRVAVRLKEKVGGKKSHNKSQDLARLTEKYNIFSKRLEGLVAVRENLMTKFFIDFHFIIFRS
jgi:hypothetical protein